jgi:hypothetical protein
MYRPKAPITTAAEVKAILGPVHPSQIAKVIDGPTPTSNQGITRRSGVGSRTRLTSMLLAAVSVAMFVWGLLAVERAVRVWAN